MSYGGYLEYISTFFRTGSRHLQRERHGILFVLVRLSDIRSRVLYETAFVKGYEISGKKINGGYGTR